MAGIDYRVIGEGQYLRFQIVDQHFVVTSGEVGAPDTAGEQNISDDDAVGGGHMETDAAVGVTGSVKHLQLLLPETDDVTFLNELVGSGEIRLLTVQPEGGAVCNRTIIDAQPRLVHQQRCLERTDTIAIAQHMVDMWMGTNDIFDL